MLPVLRVKAIVGNGCGSGTCLDKFTACRVAGSNVFVYLDRYILGVGDRIDAYSLKVLVVI